MLDLPEVKTIKPSDMCWLAHNQPKYFKEMYWVLDIHVPEVKTIKPSDICWLAQKHCVKGSEGELQHHCECPQHLSADTQA